MRRQMKGMPRNVTMRRDGYGLRDSECIKKKYQNKTEKKSKYERKRIKQKYQNTEEKSSNKNIEKKKTKKYQKKSSNFHQFSLW